MSFLSRENTYYVLYILVFLCLLVNFQTNIFGFSANSFFDGFLRYSDSIVVGSIIADDYNIDKEGGNLGFVIKGEKSPDYIEEDSYKVLSGEYNGDNLSFETYRSQYGLQGVIFSKLHTIFGINQLNHLQYFSSSLLAAVLTSLFVLYRRIYGISFSLIFMVSLASSPWIIAFSRSLYWVPFLWFLPSIFAAILYIVENKRYRWILLSLILFSVFLKSLTGYEYLSSITLLACSVFIIAPFFENATPNPTPDFKTAFFVFFACVGGFLLALLIHAGMRGDSIVNGLVRIYEEDVKRRTYGDPSLFGSIYTASLEASPFSVIKTYIVTWSTPLTVWLPGKLFKVFIAFSLFGLLLKYIIKDNTFKRDFVLLGFMFIIPVSWFILAKGHSFIHTHLNYVLWYFGFVPALLYVSISSAKAIWLEIYKTYCSLTQ